MILSDTAILTAISRDEIVIDPFDRAQLGGNSYDVRLAPVIRVYVTMTALRLLASSGQDDLSRLVASGMTDDHSGELDMAAEPKTIDVRIPDVGIVLVPGVLYLASTVEYTETHCHVPYLDGRSSVGRLGASIHVTAGRGDVGFCNHWTMEIWVVQPVRVYAGVPIGQITYHAVRGEVRSRYASKASSTYGRLARDPLPQPSRLWQSRSWRRSETGDGDGGDDGG